MAYKIQQYLVGHGRSLSMVPVHMNVGERSTTKNYSSVTLLSVVSRVFEKLVIGFLVI